MSLADRLSQKGWSKEEIDHAMHHMKLAEERKSPFKKFLEESMYWIILLVIAGAEIVFARLLFPFFAALPAGMGYIASVLLGLVCGILFGHILHDIAELEAKHHSLVLFFATFTVIGTALYVSQQTVTLAIVFSATFVLYYSYLWWRYGR